MSSCTAAPRNKYETLLALASNSPCDQVLHVGLLLLSSQLSGMFSCINYKEVLKPNSVWGEIFITERIFNYHLNVVFLLKQIHVLRRLVDKILKGSCEYFFFAIILPVVYLSFRIHCRSEDLQLRIIQDVPFIQWYHPIYIANCID